MMEFLPLGILIGLSSRKKSSIVPLTLVLALTSLVLLKRITVHSYKTDVYDHVAVTEYTKVPMNAYPTQFEEEDRAADS